jgi:hypothetical protein
LGKDSELASTLAQGKPVIAFVPEVDDGYASRLLDEWAHAYAKTDRCVLILRLLYLFNPQSAWEDETIRKWLDAPQSVSIPEAVSRLQYAVKTHYDKRAKTLIDAHPLGVQVNLETGVANGVLVVRGVEQCVELVHRIVTRSMDFALSEERGATVLREKISQCVFRVATRDAMLSNAFWNFYLEPSE